jgi:hypothetical protein
VNNELTSKDQRSATLQQQRMGQRFCHSGGSPIAALSGEATNWET